MRDIWLNALGFICGSLPGVIPQLEDGHKQMISRVFPPHGELLTIQRAGEVLCKLHEEYDFDVLCQRLEHWLTRTANKDLLETLSSQPVLSQADLTEVEKSLLDRPDTRFLYLSYAHNGKMTTHALQKFIEFEDYEIGSSATECGSIIRQYGGGKNFLDLADFNCYLYNKSQAFFSTEAFPEHENVRGLYHRPLDEYFIYSSFRSTLFADISGPCGADAVKFLLQDGCKCLHLPMCLNRSSGTVNFAVSASPDCPHSVLLHDVLQAIIENGFLVSSLPVILVLELPAAFDMHCELQLVECFTDVLGSRLYLGNDGTSTASTEATPWTLRGKVLLGLLDCPQVWWHSQKMNSILEKK